MSDPFRFSEQTAWPEKVTWTVSGLSAATSVSPAQIRNLIAAGTLRSTLAGGRRLIFVDSIREWLKAGTTA
jgi:hypothetical protein